MCDVRITHDSRSTHGGLTEASSPEVEGEVEYGSGVSKSWLAWHHVADLDTGSNRDDAMQVTR